MRLAAALLVLTLLTTSAVSGTFAKYTSEASGSSTATVAKWSFKVGSGDGTDIAPSATQTFTFNLFSTVNDTDGNEEADVATGKIAPGTSGSFDIVLTNASEVTAQYAIAFSLAEGSSSDIPLQYKVGESGTWTSTISGLDISASDSTKLAVGANATTITVYWKWAFEDASDTSRDTNDTTLGVNAASNNAATVTVTAKVTATQVD
jgi:hypothetical protein